MKSSKYIQIKKPRITSDTKVFIAFVTPAFLLVTVFVFLAILFSIGISLTKWSGSSVPVYNAFANYINMFTNADYWKSVKNTGILIILDLLIKIPLACILAYVILHVKKGYKLFRSVYFFPVTIAPLVIGLLFRMLYDGNFGLLNALLKTLGLSSLIRNWLSDPGIVLYAVAAPHVLQYVGTFFIIFLAGFLTIPTEIIESAKIDGASSSRIFFSIFLPLSKPIIQVCLILGVTDAIKNFEHAWILTAGGPGYDSAFISVYMFKVSFMSYQMGYGSAITVSIIFYALMLTLLLKRILKSDIY